MKIKVSELIVRYLERLGVEYVFGMPGSHILPVYDSLYDSPIRSVLAKHEQGASFMAGGYARATGKVAVCITTAGPGATNLVTGIANAYVDKQPILVITGETSTEIFGRGGLQESSGEGGSIDQSALFAGITRYNRIVERSDYLANVLNQTSRILLSETPGPVLLSFPFNVQKEWVDDGLLDGIQTQRRVNPIHENTPSIDAMATLLQQARHPVIVAGFGCIRSRSQGLVTELSRTLGIPVASSLKAKGVIDENSQWSLGSLGVTSSGHAYEHIVEHADLLLFLGAGFNERTSYLWDSTLLQGKKIVQVDSDPDQLEKVFKADLAVAGDLHEVLSGLLRNVQERGMRATATTGPSAEGGLADSAVLLDSHFALVEYFFKRLESHFPEGVQVVDDNIIFAQNFFAVSAQDHYYPNSGISSLGHAIPAAVGVRFARSKPTFAVLGDGGFQMCCMEIMTAVNYGLPLNIVVFNNATMGLIRKNQTQHYHNRFIDCDFVNPDFAYLAKSFGINHRRIDTEADLDEMFLRDDLQNGTNLIEITIDKNAFPNYTSRR